MAERVTVDTDRTRNGGTTFDNLGDECKRAMYPLSQDFDGHNSLRPGLFPEAEKLKDEVGKRAGAYLTRARSLKAAFHAAAAAMNDVADGFVDIENSNCTDANRYTLNEVLSKPSRHLGHPGVKPPNDDPQGGDGPGGRESDDGGGDRKKATRTIIPGS
jgi:hypothetical protein